MMDSFYPGGMKTALLFVTMIGLMSCATSEKTATPVTDVAPVAPLMNSNETLLRSQLDSVNAQLGHLNSMITAAEMRIQSAQLSQMQHIPGQEGIIASAYGEIAALKAQQSPLLSRQMELTTEISLQR